MQAADLFSIRETFDQRQIMICFNGPFTQSIIEELGHAIRRYMESESIAKNAILDVFSVYIEQTQNVRNYLVGKERDGTAAGTLLLLNSGTVVISREGDRYVVTCGNIVETTDAASLTARIDGLRGLDRSGLRALYKEQMRKPRPEGAGEGAREGMGAGLGLIDMARKAAAPLEYSLHPVDGGLSFFSLRVAV